MREWLEEHEYESVEQIKGYRESEKLPGLDRVRARPIRVIRGVRPGRCDPIALTQY
jgi:hypothetical protein